MKTKSQTPYKGLIFLFLGVTLLSIPSFETVDFELFTPLTLDVELATQLNGEYHYDFVGTYQAGKTVQLWQYFNDSITTAGVSTVDETGHFNLRYLIPITCTGENRTFRVNSGFDNSDPLYLTVGNTGKTAVPVEVENKDEDETFTSYDVLFYILGVLSIVGGIGLFLYDNGILRVERPVKPSSNTLRFLSKKAEVFS